MTEARRTVAGLEATLGQAGAGSEVRFRRLFESNIAGIIVCDVHGNVTEANDAFLEMLGHGRDDLPLRWDRMTPPEWRGLDEAKVTEILSSGAGVQWEKEYTARDGRRVPVLVAVALLDASRGECLAIVRDLSERKQLEAALREGEATYRTLYENIPLMYFTLTADRTLRSVNAHGAMELGYEQEELVGQPALVLFHPEDRPDVERELTAAVTHPEAIEYWEARMVHRSAGTLWARAAARIARGPRGEDVLLMACADVTRRRQAEQEILQRKRELRALTASLGLAEERERRRIAMGLHDDIGQTLALAKLRLGQLPGPSPSSAAARTIHDVNGLLDQAIRSTRSLTFELSSPVLYDLGLEAALESLAEEMEHRHGLGFRFRVEEPLRPMADDVKVVLYRIVCELFNNVVKHARAHSVVLSVSRTEDELRIALEDDGVGFAPAAAGEGFSPGGGFGLFSIRAQLSHLGGRLEIESSPGRGTRAAVLTPLAPVAEGAT